jgi:group II intron reverse transcriptase/maturase
VVKNHLEPRLEQEFSESSYGYRPNKSPHDALQSVRSNVRKFAWVIDLDIQAFFDNVCHKNVMLTLDRHVSEAESWIKMYVQIWLEAPAMTEQGELKPTSGSGTPQGGVISPLLANLYLHYTFDKWFSINFPDMQFARYADDMIVHCTSEKQAKYILVKIVERMASCNLTVHPDKTSIVYCKNYRRGCKYAKHKFDFLGFSFCPMSKKSKRGGMFLGYDCKISTKSYSRIIKEIRETKFNRWNCTWQDLATLFNAKIRGWIQYYDKISPRTLKGVFRNLHNRLIKWIVNYFKRFRRSVNKAAKHLRYIHRRFPYLFYHWEIGYPLV